MRRKVVRKKDGKVKTQSEKTREKCNKRNERGKHQEEKSWARQVMMKKMEELPYMENIKK